MQRIEKLNESLKRTVGKDYATKDRVNELMETLRLNLESTMMSRQMFKQYVEQTDERMNNVYELTHDIKGAVVNHTKHITKNKNEIVKRATLEEFHQLQLQLKRFALCDEYKKLYDKVVPPVQLMETQTAKMKDKVKKMKLIVARYDEALSTKANRQDVLDVENKFRKYTKLPDFEEFKGQTLDEYESLKTEVANATDFLNSVTKTIRREVNKNVRTQIQKLQLNKEKPVDLDE